MYKYAFPPLGPSAMIMWRVGGHFSPPFKAIMLMCRLRCRGDGSVRRSELGEVVAGEDRDADVTRQLGCFPGSPAPQPQPLLLPGLTGGCCQHRLPQQLVTQQAAVPHLATRGHRQSLSHRARQGSPLDPLEEQRGGVCV